MEQRGIVPKMGEKIVIFYLPAKGDKEKEVFQNIKIGLNNIGRPYKEIAENGMQIIVDAAENEYILCPLTDSRVKSMKSDKVIATFKNGYYIKQIMPRKNYKVIKEIQY